MDQKLRTVIDTFVEAIEANETIQEYQEANRAFLEDEELQTLRVRYGELTRELQQKQMDGSLTQDDIVLLRTIQNQVNNHPVTGALLRTQEDTVAILGECNQVISETLGFDFSATAAPAAAC